MRRFLLILGLAASCLPSLSAAFEISARDFRLLGISGDSDFRKLRVWSGRFTDFSGKSWDTANLYQSDRPHFNVTATVLHRLSDRFYVAHGIRLDNGYRSSLFEMTPEVNYNPTFAYVHSKATTFSLKLFGFLRYGGDVKEKPCVDDFDREFHCGTGLPWSDSHGVHLKPRRESLTSLSVRILF